MIIDKEIVIEVKSPVIIGKLKFLNINCKLGDVIHLPIERLWKGSNIFINAKCDVCHSEKKIQFNSYNKNISKYGLYTCNNICSNFKNKKTCFSKYGVENYVNINKAKNTKLEKYGNDKYVNVDKIKETKKIKYGDENYNNRDKYKKTNLEKYNSEFVLQLDFVREKTVKTNLEKYGVVDSRSSDFVKNKRRRTNLEKYGNSEYYRTDDFKCKTVKTNLEKYGVVDSRTHDIVIDKRRKTMMSKYGYISNSMSEICKEKLKQTNLERYGVEYPMQYEMFFNKQVISAKTIKYYNEVLYYQGSYEKNFLDRMNNLNLLSNICRCKPVKYMFNGINSIYYPDFYFKDLNLIIEIKSSYYYNKFYDKNIVKMKTCIDMGYNFIFVVDKNYYELERIFRNYNYI